MAKKKVKKVFGRPKAVTGRPPKISKFAVAAKRIADPEDKRVSIEHRRLSSASVVQGLIEMLSNAKIDGERIGYWQAVVMIDTALRQFVDAKARVKYFMRYETREQ